MAFGIAESSQHTQNTLLNFLLWLFRVFLAFMLLGFCAGVFVMGCFACGGEGMAEGRLGRWGGVLVLIGRGWAEGFGVLVGWW